MFGASPALFSIHTAELDRGGKDVDFVIPAEWIDRALEDSESSGAGTPGTFHVSVSKSGTDVIVSGKLAATVRTQCARCLGPAEIAVTSKMRSLFVPLSSGKLKVKTNEEGFGIDENAPDVYSYDGDRIYLDEVIRDELILEIPMNPLCSEACPGIAVARENSEEVDSGSTSKGLDPRLAPLLRLKKQLKD